MAYIFRLHAGGNNTLQGWANSQKYGRNEINQIVDPNGLTPKKQITSIPSPFAQIDLVKSAFAFVSEKDNNGNYINIQGNTIYHKMVSNALDVGQILFEYDKWKNDIEIIPWDSDNDLQELLDSHQIGHHALGDTYRLYLRQDSRTYNFGRMRRLFVLNYMNGPEELNIIGSTSPATLFMCNANDLSFVGNKIRWGEHRPFDPDNYQPLYERDAEYHKYLWALARANDEFNNLFPEFFEYLNACFVQADDNRKLLLREQYDWDNCSDIAINANQGNSVEVLGINLKQCKPKTANIEQNSDFVIASQRYTNHPLPLVLPEKDFHKEYKYTQSVWDKDTIVGQNPMLWKNRTLPDDGTQYPYLSIDDFLEKDIVRIPYGFTSTNKKDYFYGSLSENDNCHYLLPLKDLFFEFFTPEELKNNNLIKISELAGNQGVKVSLEIPIRKNNDKIEFTRIYYAHCNGGDQEHCIVEKELSFAITPNIKFNNGEKAMYRAGLVYNTNSSNSYSLEFKEYDKQTHTLINRCNLPSYTRNDNDTRYPKKCVAYAINGANFDYIRVKSDSLSGIIVPIFTPQGNGGNAFKFAVDFGTTNTHIEYSVNGGNANAFNVGDSDVQIHHLGDYDAQVLAIYDSEFMPQHIGGNSKYKFPLRTAIVAGNQVNWTQPVYSMLQSGIAFTYEKMEKYNYNRIETNLKWSNDTDNQSKIRNYIESLMFLIRNKVLYNGGNLNGTEIIWFYPLSMTSHRLGSLQTEWNDVFHAYFNTQTDTKVLTESVAPYEYYRNSKGAVNDNVATVDIGGGTTDVVIVSRQRKYITSFRFAANSIFGDGFTTASENQNGIVCQFKDQLISILEQNRETDLLKVYNQLNSLNDSANMASFLFSIKDNVKNGNISHMVDFNKKLQEDGKQKFSFILFYAAIIYHIAKIMKSKNLPMLRHIAFSGNGSKVVSALTANQNTLESFTKHIFLKVYGEQNYPEDGLTVIYKTQNPKEATCKGGLKCTDFNAYSNVNADKLVFDTAMDNILPANQSYESIIGEDNQINEGYINQSVSHFNDFLDFIFELNRDFSYKDNFGLETSSFNIAKKECRRDIGTYTKKGLGQKMEEPDFERTDGIEETMFFYPLIGILSALAEKVYNNNSQNHQ